MRHLYYQHHALTQTWRWLYSAGAHMSVMKRAPRRSLLRPLVSESINGSIINTGVKA